MIKLKALALIALLVCMQARGQTVTPVVVSSAGGHNSNSGGQIEWTIGEPVVATYVTSNRITTMGFHQPGAVEITALRESSKGSGVLVYPNPITDKLNLDFSGLPADRYELRVTDEAGRLVFISEYASTAQYSRCSLEMPPVADGVYILSVKSPSVDKIIKLTKTQPTH